MASAGEARPDGRGPSEHVWHTERLSEGASATRSGRAKSRTGAGSQEPGVSARAQPVLASRCGRSDAARFAVPGPLPGVGRLGPDVRVAVRDVVLDPVARDGTDRAVVLLIAGVSEVWMLALLAGVTDTANGFFNPCLDGSVTGDRSRGAAAVGERAALERGLDRRDPRPARRRGAGRRRRSGLGYRGRRRDVWGERGVPGDAAGSDARRGANALLRRRPA